MQGHTVVIQRLNQLLAGELTAIDQYFIHARMYENWGLRQLFERTHHEMQDETEHATWLVKRILFLDGTPDMRTRLPLRVGASAQSMLANDLALELSVVSALRDTMAYCEEVGDFQTRAILAQMLKDTEEDHAHWLEQQLGLIEAVGIGNYLQAQACR